MRKKGNNEGTIRQRSDGIYEARYTVAGKQKSIYGKTADEVRQKLIGKLNEINTGTYIEPTQLKVGEWIKEWLKVYKQKSVRPSTFERMAQLTRVHIMPEIGPVQIQKIKPYNLQKFYNDLSKKLKPATIKKIHDILHAAFSQAYKNELISSNPATKVVLPILDKHEIQIFTLEQQEEFLTAIEGEKWRVAYTLLLQTGLRIGELLSLRWKDIDLDNGVIYVRRTVKRIVTKFDEDFKPQGSTLTEQEPKTKNSRRTVPLMQSAATLMTLYKAQGSNKKGKVMKLYSGNEIVFPTRNGGLIDPKNFRRRFYQILDRAGLPKTNLHALRHTFVSRMLEAGEDIKTIAEIIGHTNVSLTMNIYAHILPEKKQKAVDKIDHLFTSVRVKLG